MIWESRFFVFSIIAKLIYIYIYFWSFHLHENIISFIFKQFLHLFCNYYKARCCYNEYKKNGVILLSWKFLLLVLYSLFIRTIHIFVIFCNCQKKRGGGRKLYKLKKDAEDTLKIEQQLLTRISCYNIYIN